MKEYWAEFGESPTFFRYVDWILTVPLMCLEFYLILKVVCAKNKLIMENDSFVCNHVSYWILR